MSGKYGIAILKKLLTIGNILLIIKVICYPYERIDE